MNIPLPCLLRGVFSGELEDGYRGELRLEGMVFENGGGHKLLAAPFPWGGMAPMPVAAGGTEGAAAVVLSVPDQLLEVHQLLYNPLSPEAMGRLTQVTDTGHELRYRFCDSGGAPLRNGPLHALDTIFHPAQYDSLRTPQALRDGKRALYTIVDGGESHHYYHPAGAEYAAPLRYLDAARAYAAAHPEQQRMGAVLNALTLEVVEPGRYPGDAGMRRPQRLPFEAARRLEAEVKESPNIRMKITVDLDRMEVEVLHNPLAWQRHAPGDFTITLDELALCLEEAEDEAAAWEGGPDEVEARMEEKLRGHLPRAPGAGSGPGGRLILADLLHLPVRTGVAMKHVDGVHFHSILGMEEWRLTPQHRALWRDVLNARVENVREMEYGDEEYGDVIELSGVRESRLRDFSAELENILEAERRMGMNL